MLWEILLPELPAKLFEDGSKAGVYTVLSIRLWGAHAIQIARGFAYAPASYTGMDFVAHWIGQGIEAP